MSEVSAEPIPDVALVETPAPAPADPVAVPVVEATPIAPASPAYYDDGPRWGLIIPLILLGVAGLIIICVAIGSGTQPEPAPIQPPSQPAQVGPKPNYSEILRRLAPLVDVHVLKEQITRNPQANVGKAYKVTARLNDFVPHQGRLAALMHLDEAPYLACWLLPDQEVKAAQLQIGSLVTVSGFFRSLGRQGIEFNGCEVEENSP